MAIQVKVLKVDFEAACSDGYVYGKLIRKTVIPVYIELGRQITRTPHPADNTSTQYKLFSGCTIYFAKAEEEIDNADDLDSLPCESSIVVTLFC